MPTMAGYGNAMVNVATSQKNHTLNGRGLTFRETYDIEPIPTLNEHKKAMCSLSMLSILRPTNSECDVDLEEAEVEVEEEIPEERPVTPINDTIVQPPKTYSVLCKHIRRRIHPRPYWPHISEHNQRSLGAVILAEVNAKWPLLRKQAKCPFLTDAQNRELQRRITVHIVIVCEQLFLFYCNQIKVLNNRAVFSEAANLTRIHGQLTLDADKYLNILAVRRHIIADLRKSEGDVGKLLSGSAEDVISRKDDRASPVFPVSPTMLSALSFRKMIAKSRTKTKKESDYDVHRELYDMHKQMPVLNTNKVAQLQTIVRRLEETRHVDEVASEHVPSLPSAEGEALDRDITPRFDKKWPSEPVLATVKLLDEEKVKSNRPTSREGDESPGGRGCVGDHRLTGPGRPATAAGDHVPSHVCKSHHTALAELAKKGGIREDDKAAAPADESAASINPSQDLVRLVEKQTIAKEKDPQIIALMESPDDIPPLLQAITRYGKQNDRHRKLLETERELDERKRMMDEEEMEPLPEPKFPQPPVVQFKLPGHCNPVDRTPMVVRSSDVHIPNKVELTKSSLSVYGPLFNDLTGDISPATVKALDANLFQGAELREVYDEIMKTVPNLHRQFDNDDLVVPPADDVDLNKILASSTLLRPKSQQIINRSLAKSGQAPPWGGEHPRESIADQRRRSRAGADTAMTMSRGDGGGSESLRVVSRLAPVADKSSREYASWLAWWKATITTDDYLKYLATQETDYLGVIFHFYDSEAAPSDTESTSKTHQLEMDRLRDQRIADIKAAKTERIEGMWNANSVMLGGLGKLPDIEDADLMADLGDVDLELAFERTSSAHTEDYRVESKAREVTEGTSATCATSEMSGEVTVKDVAQLQRRFEVVWKRLRTPLDQKVDLAMKYSSDQFMPLLAESVAAYERATGLILRREQIVRELDLFERQASDPGRFFAKGWKGSGLARLDEARTRSNIYKRLDRIESRIAPILAAVYRQFGDVVTYCGRPYDEKMSCDKVEMLYWLQQERRCRQLAIAGETLQWQMFFQDNHTDEKETADDNPGNVSAGEPLAPSNSRVISSARV